jgi:hypothetical protein
MPHAEWASAAPAREAGAAELSGDRRRLRMRSGFPSMDPHRLAEARSLALHIEILSRLEQDPSLLSQVRARLSE